MTILADQVARYLRELRPTIDPLLAEMEELAQREGIPIVHRETGRLLALLCRLADPHVLEVGTAIGYSTVHMARELRRGRIVTLERDPVRAAQARDFLERAGCGARVEVVEGDALETLPRLDGTFNLLFLDGTKTEYARYLALAEPLLAPAALVAVDNVLMGGEVAWSDDRPGAWTPEQRSAVRDLARKLVASERWQGVVLPVGDGVALASAQKVQH
ncbi:O-methyltransferase [Thermoleophilum album]|uniref:Predicted O-methyltransferase YrrM n=1 Tax=Thermoleophilum album TaxID=29539 RepID=A0A1H6FMS6_THEAL|nr:O-methyltransferase [Thermoleophilum album]SEH12221.1 Predicted O-methyltransferase YrrM [Thermoleophilum album]